MPTGFTDSANITGAFAQWGRQHGWSLPLFGEEARAALSYRTFYRTAWALGKVIAARHTPGERIGVLLPSTIGAAAVFYAAIFYRLIPVMLNPTAGEKNTVSSCHTAQVDTVYTAQKLLDNLPTAPALVAAMRDQNIDVVCLEDLRPQINAKVKIGAVAASALPLRSAAALPGASAAADEAAVILFTSGSEGTPKGVVLSHGNIMANTAQVLARLPMLAGHRMINCLPIFHSFGLLAGVVLPAAGGMVTLQYPSPLHYRQIPRVIERHKPAIFFSANTFLRHYAQEASPAQMESLRWVFAGAEKLQDTTRKLWADKFNLDIMEGYGVTETSPVLSVNTPEDNCHGTVGRVLDDVDTKLTPVEGIVDGGRLHVKGPNIMLGYLHADKPGELHPPHDGWHDTGDIAAIDTSGQITIKGRARRFIKIAGEMVPLDGIEESLRPHWPDFDFAAIGIASEERGEELLLLTTKADLRREEIATALHHAGRPSLWIPRHILTVESVPVLSTGKPDFGTMQSLAAAAQAEGKISSV